ncbi:MAG: hypothetical protein AAF515_07225 [Pseudomonadota bacterium]
MSRQQVLYLWLAEGALDTATVGWSFYDGSAGRGPALPEAEPPYRNGLAALEDGWFLLQSPAPAVPMSGAEHGASYLPNEFVFTRTVDPDS